MILFLLISIIIIKISIIVSIKLKLNYEKISPFECGFNPIFFQRLPFSIQFFLISIIFLIFDIEISILFPLFITFKTSNLCRWTITRIIFLIILLIGLFHEWNQGILNWI